MLRLLSTFIFLHIYEAFVILIQAIFFQALVVSLSDIKKETDYVVGLHNIELLFGSSPL